MRALIILLALVSCDDAESPDRKERVTDCDLFCETVSCAAIDICVESREQKTLAVWYEAETGEEFYCNGSDCTTAAADVIDYCGLCL